MLQRTPDYNYISVLFISTRGSLAPLPRPSSTSAPACMDGNACRVEDGVYGCKWRAPAARRGLFHLSVSGTFAAFVQRSGGTSKLTALGGTQSCVRASRGADFAPPTRRRTIWIGRLNVARLRGV